MIIKVLGSACPNCMKLEKKVKDLIAKHNIKADVLKVTDIQDIMLYGVMSTPALVVDEKVVAKGRIPNDKELLKLLSE